MTTIGGSNFFKYKAALMTSATLAFAMALPAHADDSSEPSVTVGGGLAVGPLYEGSSHYAAFPSLKLKAVLPTIFCFFSHTS